MHQRHSEALNDPDDVEKHREGELALCSHYLSRWSNGAHQQEAQKGDTETCGYRPLSSYLVCNDACNGETDYGGGSSDYCQDHGC